MMSFPLKIVTPDGLVFDGTAEKLIVRTITGDMAVLARHINCVVPLGMGQAIVETNGERREAACIGGMLNVFNGEVTLVPTTFEWAEDIDLARAEEAERRAQEELARHKAYEAAHRAAQARLRRALVRKNVARRRYRG